jgi:hypothetical protein
VHETRVNTGESVGGPGRDRTDDLFHAMEARSQLRHRPTSGDTTVVVGATLIILADCADLVNAAGCFFTSVSDFLIGSMQTICRHLEFSRFFHRHFLP